jgi:DNA end-binding protein Ku
VARAIWSGSISFGLVNVPVRMYSAIDEKDLHFHLLHMKDDSRIGYEKTCKKEGKPVSDDEIGTAYEISKGRYVYLTDEDFEAAEPKGYRSIDLTEFVDVAEIDPIYFDRTYFLGPAKGAEKVYAVLAKAMDRSGLAAIGTYVMRNKQHLGCVRVRDGVLTLSKLYFADEIRPHDELASAGARVSKQELEMASELIDRFTTRFDIGRYRDSYRAALLAVIKAKQKGKEIRVEPAEEKATPSDLLSALRESVARHSQAKGSRSGGRRGGSFSELTKSELERKAKRKRVKGYSTMTKDELVAALQ